MTDYTASSFLAYLAFFMIKYPAFIILNIIDLGAETPTDPEYKRFLENYSCDEEKSMANPETLLGEIEAKTRELIGDRKSVV